jgi:hypothetical protein
VNRRAQKHGERKSRKDIPTDVKRKNADTLTNRGHQAVSRFKFALSFENSIAQDYVTEKFYHPLIAGSVPVTQPYSLILDI